LRRVPSERPPRVAEWLLRTLPKDARGQSIRGDLYEEYGRRRRDRGRVVWITAQAFFLATRYLGYGLRSRSGRGDLRRGGGGVGRDLRFATRRLRKHPAFTMLAVATLGLGIGSVTTILTVVDRVLLRDLPYPAPHQLVTVWNTYPTWRGHEVLDPYWDTVALSYPEYRDWREGNRAFQSVAIYTTGVSTVTGSGSPARIGFGTASASLFPMLGARPVIGRFFRQTDEADEASRVAVISHRFWTSQFGQDAGAVNRTVTVDGERYTIVGVLPETFRIRSLASARGDDVDIWAPAGIFGEANDRGHHLYEAVGRLNPGVTLPQAMADVGPLLRGDQDVTRQDVRVLSREREEVAESRGPLLLLLGAGVILMIIACINVAAVFMAEITGRRHELATRKAIGANRWQMSRQLLAESVCLGVLGAVVGIAVSFAGVRILLNLAPSGLMLPAHVPVFGRVLGWTILLGVVIGVLFGVGPALVAARFDVTSLTSARRLAGYGKSRRIQRGMVTMQSGLAVVLVVLGGVLTRSLIAVQSVDPGFDPEQILAVSVPVTGPRTANDRMPQFARAVRERVARLPGVTGVTGANSIPFSGAGSSSSFQIEGRPVGANEKLPEAHRRTVLPGFHQMLAVPVLAGRTLTDMDDEDAPPVVVVSEALAKQYFPGTSPIGAFLIRDRRRWEIVGVVGDILHGDLTAERQSTYYFSFYQQPPNQFWLLIRSAITLETLVPQIRQSVAEIAPDVAVGRVETLPNLVRLSTAEESYRMTLIVLFGVFSLTLAAVGVFGTTARTVAARRRELGVRLALGADWKSVAKVVSLGELRAVVIGVVLGLVVAWSVTSTIGGLLFGVAPHDPVSFAMAAAMLIGAGAVASYIPARRVATVDPVEALQAD